MSDRAKLVVFISGRGSNLNAIINACKNNIIKADIVAVFSNKSDVYGLKYAAENSIDSFVIENKNFADRESYDYEVINFLNKINYDLICFAGYMRLVSRYFLENVKSPVINIHPSLLPKYKGGNAIFDAYNANEKEFGCTVHHVILEMDAGDVILQKKILREKDDDLSSIKHKIHKIEHETYIEALNLLIK